MFLVTIQIIKEIKLEKNSFQLFRHYIFTLHLLFFSLIFLYIDFNFLGVLYFFSFVKEKIYVFEVALNESVVNIYLMKCQKKNHILL